jgi:hypothetical protein
MTFSIKRNKKNCNFLDLISLYFLFDFSIFFMYMYYNHETNYPGIKLMSYKMKLCERIIEHHSRRVTNVMPGRSTMEVIFLITLQETLKCSSVI